MLTRIELDQAEAVFHCLPRIADSLESIAKTLETLRCSMTLKDACTEESDCSKGGDND